MSTPAEMYSFGAQYWIVVPTMILIVIVINYVLIPVFYNNHISNCYEVITIETILTKKKNVIINFLFQI